MQNEAARVLRAAVYTRKSSDEGLEQSFNSLDAQRAACEAYVLSQAGEGWVLHPETYDDGGWSGGNLDRPALQRLLADIELGKVDVVVVYKVDRLTRSLTDFAKIVEILDRQGASFVSVTQAFNTTSSMGRLTLNVLLSFAQFERDVTSERIRDKIAASKRKGLWMGGNLPLGYDAPADPISRTLSVNSAEAETVRTIFSQYLKLDSVNELQQWLQRKGFRSKRWTSSEGRVIGGAVFSRGALLHLLKNRVYLGEIVHKSDSYPGAHVPIVPRELFDAVQAKLEGKARPTGRPSGKAARAPLCQLLFDADGHPMSPTVARGRHGKLYRYYVSSPLQRGAKPAKDGTIRRAPAEPFERFVAEAVERVTGTSLQGPEPAKWRRALAGVELRRSSVQIILHDDVCGDVDRARAQLNPDEILDRADGSGRLCLTINRRFQTRGGRTSARGVETAPRPDPALIRALRRAHDLLSDRCGSEFGFPERAVLSEAPANPYERKLLRLAFLAPDLQRNIVAGRQPGQLNLQRLINMAIPASWAAQREVFDRLK
jgi:DNA invertase Pin-like site-specific DNA recombinase